MLIPGTRRAVAVTVEGVAVYDVDSGTRMYAARSAQGRS